MEEMIAISLVRVPPERAGVDEEAVLRLVESIRLVGLMHPITLRPDRTLAAGRTRLEACRRLDMTMVPVRWLATDDPNEATIAEVDENLMRRELSALERSDAVARREAAYHALHEDQRPRALTRKFVQQLRQQSGLTTKQIERDRYIAKHLSEYARKTLAGTAYADNGVLLYEIARLTPEGQRAAVDELRAALARGESPLGRTRRSTERAKNPRAGTEMRTTAGEDDAWSQEQEHTGPIPFPTSRPRNSTGWDEMFAFLERARERSSRTRGLKAAAKRLSAAEQATRAGLLADLLPTLEEWQRELAPKKRRGPKAN
jgi:hypothetical protein